MNSAVLIIIKMQQLLRLSSRQFRINYILQFPEKLLLKLLQKELVPKHKSENAISDLYSKNRCQKSYFLNHKQLLKLVISIANCFAVIVIVVRKSASSLFSGISNFFFMLLVSIISSIPSLHKRQFLPFW